MVAFIEIRAAGSLVLKSFSDENQFTGFDVKAEFGDFFSGNG